jgi:hypothetical protein
MILNWFHSKDSERYNKPGKTEQNGFIWKTSPKTILKFSTGWIITKL